ncbi:hypothetical protein IW22_02555 [Chryseobacterium sp. JM1]|nr:hypothetical protein IW22_02555 [Chryseobacterium sp. JM1]
MIYQYEKRLSSEAFPFFPVNPLQIYAFFLKKQNLLSYQVNTLQFFVKVTEYGLESWSVREFQGFGIRGVGLCV